MADWSVTGARTAPSACLNVQIGFAKARKGLATSTARPAGRREVLSFLCFEDRVARTNGMFRRRHGASAPKRTERLADRHHLRADGGSDLLPRTIGGVGGRVQALGEGEAEPVT